MNEWFKKAPSSEDFRNSRLLTRVEKTERLGQISPKEYSLLSWLKTVPKRSFLRFLTALSLGAGLVATDIPDNKDLSSENAVNIKAESVPKTKEMLKIEEIKEQIKNLEALKNILEQELLNVEYAGTEEEKEFADLVSKEMASIQKIYGNQEEWLKRVYGQVLPKIPELFESAERIGVPSGILLGVVLEESGFNSKARNRQSSAKGKMQILDGTAAEWQTKFDKMLDRWIAEGRKNLLSSDIEFVKDQAAFLELKEKIAAGEDLRDDGLYLGAFGLQQQAQKFGNWSLAVASYKIGAGKTRELSKNNCSDKKSCNFTSIRKDLKGEDSNYEARVEAEARTFIVVLNNIINSLKANLVKESENNVRNIFVAK